MLLGREGLCLCELLVLVGDWVCGEIRLVVGRWGWLFVGWFGFWGGFCGLWSYLGWGGYMALSRFEANWIG